MDGGMFLGPQNLSRENTPVRAMSLLEQYNAIHIELQPEYPGAYAECSSDYY